MFGPYEVIRGAHVWHGGVELVEYHLVERDGECFLFLVREVACRSVSADVVRAVARLKPGLSALIPDEQMCSLRESGLVVVAAGGWQEARKSGPAVAAGRADSRRSKVVHLVLALAQTCNLRCVYCIGDGGEYGRPGMMSEATALAAVDWLIQNSGDAERVRLSFAGGEPLLAFALLQRVVAYAKGRAAARGKAVSFSLTTNGSLLTNRVVPFLIQEGISVTVSFDGPAEIQDRQRPFRNGRGSWRRVSDNVRRLLAAVPDAMGQATVCAGSDPFAVRRGLREAGFRNYALNRASPVLPRRPLAQEAPHEDAGRMLAYRRAEVAGLLAAVRDRRLDPWTSPGEQVMLTRLATGRKNHAACAVGRGVVAVAATGDLYPCPSFLGLEEQRLGHIDDRVPVAVVDPNRVVVDELPVCRTCWARYLCGGGCSYENLARTGDASRPAPFFCREMRTVCEDLIQGWCRLSDEDRAYVRQQAGQVNRAPCS